MHIILACMECSGTKFFETPDEDGVYECLTCGQPSSVDEMVPTEVESEEDL